MINDYFLSLTKNDFLIYIIPYSFFAMLTVLFNFLTNTTVKYFVDSWHLQNYSLSLKNINEKLVLKKLLYIL